MNTECIVLTPCPRGLPHKAKVQVDVVETRHILIPIHNFDVARFSMMFARHVEENYHSLDPREKLLVYYSPSDFSSDKLDLVVEELRRWIEEWLENDRIRCSS